MCGCLCGACAARIVNGNCLRRIPPTMVIAVGGVGMKWRWFCVGKVYERCVAGMERECEAVVAELVELCPWMTGLDVMALRQAFGAQAALVAGEDVDVGAMAGCLL